MTDQILDKLIECQIIQAHAYQKLVDVLSIRHNMSLVNDEYNAIGIIASDLEELQLKRKPKD